MAIRTFGTNAVDWEQRVDFDRLRTERLARLKEHLERSELGALLSFDFANIRYMTATHIGTWAMDKLIRFALLPRGGEPVVWDFGSAARHHQLYNPWLDHTPGEPTAAGAARTGARAGISTLRGAFHPDAGIATERGQEGRGRTARAWACTASRSASTSSRCRCLPPSLPRASGRSTGSRSSSRRAGSRPPTRSRCSPRPARWWTPPTTSCTRSCVPACGRTSAWGWSARCCTTWAASTSKASTRSPASAARRTRTCSATGSSGRETPRSSTSCTASTATGRATTGRSRSAARRRAQRDAYVRCREYMDAAIARVRPGATTGRHRGALAAGHGVRLPRRDRCVRAAVRPWGWACRSGRNRSSAGWCPSTIPRRWRRAWCSRSRPTGQRPTAGRPRGSRRRSS